MPRANFTVSTKDPKQTGGEQAKRPVRLTALERRQPFGTRGYRLVAGCMTGTSLDALDVALVAVHGEGLSMRVELEAETTRPLGILANDLRRLANQETLSAGAITALAHELGLLHLDAIKELKRGRTIDLVSVHGQTIFHAPPLSWQLINPGPIAYTLGMPVVFDLRAGDLASGGQGAPLTPIADLVLFGHGSELRTVVNLGGFCNITRLPGGRDTRRVQGGDVCACNHILDAIAREKLGTAYDRDGRAAWQGETDDAAVASLVRRLQKQKGSGRSLGTGDETLGWMAEHPEVPPADLARSACAAIATVIAEAVKPSQRVIIAGGGTRNRALVHEIKGRADVTVDMSDDHGVPATLREAMAWAVLGAICQDRVPVTLSQVTGAERIPVSGYWVLP